MENLVINGTNVAPTIVFQSSGKLKIEGKIITENAILTFDPIFQWLNEFQAKSVEFDIILEYMNTSASMQLYSLLSRLEENQDIQDIKVNWFYEVDDEEHLETGELFEDRLERTVFKYIVIDETRDAA